MPSMTINPMLTTSPQNSFILESGGYIQGLSMDNQPSRIQLEQGSLVATSTNPVWGAVMVNQMIPAINNEQLGNSVQIATAQRADFGFVVNDRAYNMIIGLGNQAPLSQAGMSCMYYPNGKWARVPVQCSSALAAALENGFVDQVVYWDFVNQLLTTTGTTALPCRVKGFNSQSLIISYSSVTGLATYSVGYCALIEF